MTEVPTMFDSSATFGGITVSVDPINRTRTEASDNVMAMFYEEQPFMWEYVKDELTRTIVELDAPIDFLDVGTGSGVWSLLVGRNAAAKNILAIDKNARAIEVAKENAKRNGIDVTFRHESYGLETAPPHSVKVIGIYAPYHLYPEEVTMQIPQHARGGSDGQRVFRNQLHFAGQHLAKKGAIVFNQMCLGRNGQPNFEADIMWMLPDCSLRYIDILAPIETGQFLRGVYGDRFKEYQEQTAREFPELYYCDGIIRRDGRGVCWRDHHKIPLHGRTWQDRIELHREIAKHASL